LDLYFRVEQQVEFSSEGKGEIYLSGYFEPDEGESIDEEVSEEEEEELRKASFNAI